MPILWSISGSPWRRGSSRQSIKWKRHGSNLAARLSLVPWHRQDTLWPVNCQYCRDRFHEKAWDRGMLEPLEPLFFFLVGKNAATLVPFDRCCSRPWLRLPLLEVLGTSCCQLEQMERWNIQHGTMLWNHTQNVVPRCTNGYYSIPNGIYFWCTSLVRMRYAWN